MSAPLATAFPPASVISATTPRAVFAEQGFTGASIADVVERAGSSVGSLYRVTVPALHHAGGQPPWPPRHVDTTVSPCSAQRAVHWSGVTWTTIRRRHCGQYRGGSSSSDRAQASWPPSARGRPQRPQ
jgi:Bacterial regulatory proteins, tetR family